MLASTFQDTLRHTPFRPFEIHTDGRTILITHPEQVLITPDQSTVVAVEPDNHINILDMEHISALKMRPSARRQSPKAAA